MLVAQKRRAADPQAFVDANLGPVSAELRSGARPIALGFHLAFEPVHVHGDTVLAGYLLCHLNRESVGVPEPKNDVSSEVRGLFHRCRKNRVAVLERLLEAIFLQLQNGQHKFAVVDQLRVDVAHLVNCDICDFAEEVPL